MTAADRARKELEALPPAVRLQVVLGVWESLEDEPDAFALSEAEAEELDRRYASHLSGESRAVPWSDVKAEFLKEK
jgi:putative addiction module component (TIGR02574 family)